MKMVAVLLAITLMFSVALAEDTQIDLTELTLVQLNEFKDGIDAEIKLHHKSESSTESVVLNTVKEVVKSHFAEQGIEISWAWVNYTYTRDWDFYTVSTHIDYRDAANEKQKSNVYAELFPENSEYAVYYLLVGTELLINRRDELPDTLWVEEPQGIINAATGMNLSKVSVSDLTALKTAIEREIKANHSTNSTTNSVVLSLTKLEIEKYFAQQNINVSWAWFDYDYTCDWGLYTLTTPINYRNSEDKNQKSIVYAESYPIAGQYTLTYLTVDDTILVNRRDELPSDLSAAILSSTEAPKETTDQTTPTPTVTPDPTKEPESTILVVSEQKPEGLSYSTNDKTTVKNGNTGVYAYRSRGGTYYNYWIIDFDEGYVYGFSEGNGNSICDRLKIESGDLNDVLIITYHDGSDVWSYGLHFKWKRQPDILILQDNDGFEYSFYTTFLEDALNIRDTKTIVDY